MPEELVETVDITSQNDSFRLIRKFNTRCCDSFLWTYSGVVKFLKYMNKNPQN